MSIQIINLNNDMAGKSTKVLKEKSVEAIVSNAQAALTHWKESSYQQRVDLLHEVAMLMRVKKTALAKIIPLGKGQTPCSGGDRK